MTPRPMSAIVSQALDLIADRKADLVAKEHAAKTAYLVALHQNKPSERLHRKWALAHARMIME